MLCAVQQARLLPFSDVVVARNPALSRFVQSDHLAGPAERRYHIYTVAEGCNTGYDRQTDIRGWKHRYTDRWTGRQTDRQRGREREGGKEGEADRGGRGGWAADRG